MGWSHGSIHVPVVFFSGQGDSDANTNHDDYAPQTSTGPLAADVDREPGMRHNGEAMLSKNMGGNVLREMGATHRG